MSRVAMLRLFRILAIASFVLFLSGIAPVLRQGSPAAAQADELTQREFSDLLELVQAQDPVFGPDEGELDHDADVVSLSFADSDVDLADFVATATFRNPFAGRTHRFDFGFQFRSADVDGDAAYLRLIVLNSGAWELVDHAGNRLAEGSYADIDERRSGENSLTIYADGQTVHFAINGDYAGSADVKLTEAGGIAVGSAFSAESARAGSTTAFADFTVWELPGSDANTGNRSSGPATGVPRPPRPGSNVDAEDDPAPTDPQAEPNEKPVGTRYESPTYGYTLRYDDSWTLNDQFSSDGIDTLVLDRGASTLVIYGIPAGRTAEECRDALISLYADGVENADLDTTLQQANSGTVDSGNRAGTSYMFVRTTIKFDDGDSVGITNYFECGPVDGSADYFVGIRYSSSDLLFESEYPALRDLVDTLSASGTAADDDAGSRTDKPPADTANRGTNISEGEDDRLVYISPTYGFTVEILPDWTIEENSVQNGYDTLVVASDTGRVTVSGFSSTGTAIGCIDSILGNLNADPGLANVSIGVQPDGTPSRWDSDTTSEVVVFFTANGTNYVRYYACFSGSDGQSMLVFAYEALEANIKTEFANIEAMLDLIRVP